MSDAMLQPDHRLPASFVRRESSPTLPPPASQSGWVAWLVQNFFGGPLSSILTVASILMLAWLLPGLIRYLFIDAVWSAPDGVACRAPGAGACWAYIDRKIDYFRYGSYPADERWRVDLVIMTGMILIVRLLWPQDKKGRLAAGLFILLLPVATFALMPGFGALQSGGMSRWLDLAFGIAFAALCWSPAMTQARAAGLFFIVFPVLAFGLLTGANPFAFWRNMSLVGALVVLLLILGTGVGLSAANKSAKPLLYALGLIVAVIAGDLLWTAWSSAIRLPRVETNFWGGILVSMVVATVGITVSLPLGILLALGRRSQLPIVKFFCVLFIEFVRGVPLITVLFMANTMLPLFVPDNWSPDRLLRPLIGVALFASAYMAEVIRGGLQAMPKGQYEGAMALGLSTSQMMRLVVLPQALTLVIPGIVNTFIGLFKDTTLVAIVGIFDFLRTVDAARIDPAWSGPQISATGYIFAASFYFIFCFGMSRYSLWMERKLSAGRKH